MSFGTNIRSSSPSFDDREVGAESGDHRSHYLERSAAAFRFWKQVSYCFPLDGMQKSPYVNSLQRPVTSVLCTPTIIELLFCLPRNQWFGVAVSKTNNY
jgi:hypothetical protein